MRGYGQGQCPYNEIFVPQITDAHADKGQQLLEIHLILNATEYSDTGLYPLIEDFYKEQKAIYDQEVVTLAWEVVNIAGLRQEIDDADCACVWVGNAVLVWEDDSGCIQDQCKH